MSRDPEKRRASNKAFRERYKARMESDPDFAEAQRAKSPLFRKSMASGKAFHRRQQTSNAAADPATSHQTPKQIINRILT